MFSAGWLMARVVYGEVGPAEDDIALTAEWAGIHKALSEKTEACVKTNSKHRHTTAVIVNYAENSETEKSRAVNKKNLKKLQVVDQLF